MVFSLFQIRDKKSFLFLSCSFVEILILSQVFVERSYKYFNSSRVLDILSFVTYYSTHTRLLAGPLELGDAGGQITFVIDQNFQLKQNLNYLQIYDGVINEPAFYSLQDNEHMMWNNCKLYKIPDKFKFKNVLLSFLDSR